MANQIIQLATTAAHILALDSSGNIWWRRWDKKGWNKMENPALPAVSDPSATVLPATPHMPQIQAQSIVPPVAIQAPVIAPLVQSPIDSHQDPA